MYDHEPVIGRDDEVRDVTEMLSSAGPSARTLLLTGAAGTGKTAVLEQARGAMADDGAKILSLPCGDEGTAGGLALADALLGGLRRIHPGRLPGVGTETQQARRRSTGGDAELALLSTLGKVLTDVARHTPFALVADGIERLPRATASALWVLLRVFRPLGVPVVLAGRPMSTKDGGAAVSAAADRVLRLGPLRPADVEALAVRRLGCPVEPALVAAVLEALGQLAGNPRAVLSVLDSLRERGELLELDGHVGLAGPEPDLRLTTDLAELGDLCWPKAPPDALAFEVAAGLARIAVRADVRLDDWFRLTPKAAASDSATERTLDRLIRERVVTLGRDGRTSFAVPALAASLCTLFLGTDNDKSPFHAQITTTVIDRLGAGKAGAGHPRLIDHVAAAGSRLDDSLAVPVLLAAARRETGADWSRSVRGYALALRRLAPDDPRTVGTLRRSAELSLRHADHPGALALGEPLLACLKTASTEEDRNDLEFVARVWALAALHEHRSPYADDAGPEDREILRHVPAAAELAALGPLYGAGPLPQDLRSGTCPAGSGAAEPVSGSGPLPSSAEVRLVAAAVGDDVGFRQAFGALPQGSVSAEALDRLRNAASYGDLAGALAAVLGSRYTGAGDSQAAGYRTMVHQYLAGDWDDAFASARRLEARGRSGGPAGAVQPARALASEMHCIRGQAQKATAWLERVPGTFTHPHFAWARLKVRYLTGAKEHALEQARQDVRRARESGLLAGVERVVVRVLKSAVSKNLPDIARESLDVLEELYGQMASPTVYEALLFARGAVHADIDSALAAHRLVDDRGDVCMGLLCVMNLARVTDDPAHWLAEFTRRGHVIGVGPNIRAAVANAARERNVSLPKPRAAKVEWHETDVRVAGMVSQGATNRQIAAQLNCSVKTVEQRLTRLFQRTGCRSRSELAASWLNGNLARLGLVPDIRPGTR
ncbi:LuxR family transcriptional regulator [Streptomyces sp. NPDC048281]|uniref:helix-turn-helix transcriptional regulator n=1 Tax=Streptomyces sp. NPDC048281 TaxID=3154715 RepID=UPI0034459B28